MIYVHVTEEKVRVVTSEEAKAMKWVDVQDRHDWKTMQDAEDIALLLNLHNDEKYIAIDNGEWCSPRFDVLRMPQVGDDVSYGFNGDYYPCGKIKSISKTLKKITTTEGKDFFRRRQSGSWVMNGTWSLIHGTINERNPHF
jgi:hypothetical protein